jgi:D-3-phosphoglycerate dehydrogenase / 2-oxoglutarate reductase
MSDKILVTTRSFRKIDGRHKDILREAGYDLIDSPYDRPLTGLELGQLLADSAIVGAILGVDDVTGEALQAASDSLRVISRYGVGVDRVDLLAATGRGIVVTITPGANAVAVAELTLAMVLALARNLTQQDRLARSDDWRVLSGAEITDSTLGLIGLGRIGIEVARRAAGMGMRLIYHDPVPPPPDVAEELKLAYVPLDDLLADSDFVSLHLPLLPETRHLIDRAALERMKPTAYLINTARGGLVDEAALHDALAAGHLAGAAADVFAQEPPQGNPLLKLDNFIATSHIGSATRQTTLRMGLMAAENALAVLRGERPEHVANPEVYEQSP